MRIDASISLSQSITPDKTEQKSETIQKDSTKSQKSDSEDRSKKEESVKKAQERQIVAELQVRDTQVRAHEAAHLAAAGGIASGGASFSYQRGPDGKMYAIGGEVPISAGGGGSAQETVKRMRQVAAAAMAPADPSPQDYAVAANARSEEMKALQELRKEQTEAQKEQGLKKYLESASKSAEIV
ncbi:MAG: hypothetical protein L3J42_04400 [Hydrogenimonas sp.]|nr:hypothetical protein [Hydrogenimonas sp.]